MIIINHQSKEQILEDLDFKQSKKTITKAQKEEKIAQLDALELVYEKYRGKMVTATMYQLVDRLRSGTGDVFSTEHKKLLRNNCSIEASHFVNTNWMAMECGRIYVLNEEATDKKIVESEQRRKDKIAKDQFENEVGAEVGEALKAIGEAAKKRVGRPAKQN